MGPPTHSEGDVVGDDEDSRIVELELTFQRLCRQQSDACTALHQLHAMGFMRDLQVDCRVQNDGRSQVSLTIIKLNNARQTVQAFGETYEDAMDTVSRQVLDGLVHDLILHPRRLLQTPTKTPRKCKPTSVQKSFIMQDNREKVILQNIIEDAREQTFRTVYVNVQLDLSPIHYGEPLEIGIATMTVCAITKEYNIMGHHLVVDDQLESCGLNCTERYPGTFRFGKSRVISSAVWQQEVIRTIAPAVEDAECVFFITHGSNSSVEWLDDQQVHLERLPFTGYAYQSCDMARAHRAESYDGRFVRLTSFSKRMEQLGLACHNHLNVGNHAVYTLMMLQKALDLNGGTPVEHGNDC